ncbi:MAG: hypothetical protein V8S76_00445 [Lachnospiraceae bacterium]
MLKKSFVEQKYNDLMRLNIQSNAALDIINNTINRLESINTEIDSTISEINDAQDSLNNTVQELSKTKRNNSTIASKFKQLLEVEE